MSVNSQNNRNEKENNISKVIKKGIKIKRGSLISQGVPRKKKSGSMLHVLKDKNKININISQNININTNIKELEQNKNEQKIIDYENKSKNYLQKKMILE